MPRVLRLFSVSSTKYHQANCEQEEKEKGGRGGEEGTETETEEKREEGGGRRVKS